MSGARPSGRITDGRVAEEHRRVVDEMSVELQLDADEWEERKRRWRHGGAEKLLAQISEEPPEPEPKCPHCGSTLQPADKELPDAGTWLCGGPPAWMPRCSPADRSERWKCDVPDCPFEGLCGEHHGLKKEELLREQRAKFWRACGRRSGDTVLITKLAAEAAAKVAPAPDSLGMYGVWAAAKKLEQAEQQRAQPQLQARLQQPQTPPQSHGQFVPNERLPPPQRFPSHGLPPHVAPHVVPHVAPHAPPHAPPHGHPPHGLPPHGLPPHGLPPHGLPPRLPPHGLPPQAAPYGPSTPHSAQPPHQTPRMPERYAAPAVDVSPARPLGRGATPAGGWADSHDPTGSLAADVNAAVDQVMNRVASRIAEERKQAASGPPWETWAASR